VKVVVLLHQPSCKRNFISDVNQNLIKPKQTDMFEWFNWSYDFAGNMKKLLQLRGSINNI
jgi:hypothetical protein